MKRVLAIKAAGDWAAVSAIDRVVLDAGDRHRRRIVLTGEKGTRIPARLRKAGDAARRRRPGARRRRHRAGQRRAGGADRSFRPQRARHRAARLASRQPPHRRADRRRQNPHPPRSRAGGHAARPRRAADAARSAVRSGAGCAAWASWAQSWRRKKKSRPCAVVLAQAGTQGVSPASCEADFAGTRDDGRTCRTRPSTA